MLQESVDRNLLSIVPIAWRSPEPVDATNLPEFRLRSWYCTATVTEEGAAAQRCIIRYRSATPARRESGGAMAETGGGWRPLGGRLRLRQRRNARAWSHFTG